MKKIITLFFIFALISPIAIAQSEKPLQCGTLGDVNGDNMISQDDANLIAYHIVGTSTLTANALENADVTGDGKISAVDSLAIGQYVAGTRQIIPACGISITSVSSSNGMSNWKDIIIEVRNKTNASQFYQVGNWTRASNTFVSNSQNLYNPTNQIISFGMNAPKDKVTRLAEQTLTFTFSSGEVLKTYVPRIEVPEGKFVRLYASNDGSTYYLHPGQFGPATPYSANAIVSSPALLQSQLAKKGAISITSVSSTNATGNSKNMGLVVLKKTSNMTGAPMGVLTRANIFIRNDSFNSFDPSTEIIAIAMNSDASGDSIAKQTLTIRFSDGSDLTAYVPAVTLPPNSIFRMYIDNYGNVYFQDTHKDGSGLRYSAFSIASNEYLRATLLAGTLGSATGINNIEIHGAISSNPSANEKDLIIEVRNKTNATQFYQAGIWSRASNSFVAYTNTLETGRQILAIGANARNDSNMTIPEQTLTLIFSNSQVLNVYIPHIEVPAGKFVRLYIAEDGSTYYMHPGKFGPATPYSVVDMLSTPAVLSNQLARKAPLSIVFVTSTNATGNSKDLIIEARSMKNASIFHQLGNWTKSINAFTPRETTNSFEKATEVLSIGANAGNTSIIIAQQAMNITFSDMSSIIAYIPHIEVPAGKFVRLYVDQNGSTYYIHIDKFAPGSPLSPEQILTTSLRTTQLARTAPVVITQEPTPSSPTDGGGDSGGSGGSTGGESGSGAGGSIPFSRHVLDQVISNVNYTFRTQDQRIAIIEMKMATNVNENFTVIILDKPYRAPASFKENSMGKVYQYNRIRSSRISNDELKFLDIKYAVDKSWLEDNKYEMQEMVIYQKSGTGWLRLNSSIVSTQGRTVEYKARTMGFGEFIIAGLDGANVPIEITGNATDTNGGNNQTNGTNGGTGQVPAKPATDMGIIIIAIILIVVLIALAWKFFS